MQREYSFLKLQLSIHLSRYVTVYSILVAMRWSKRLRWQRRWAIGRKWHRKIVPVVSVWKTGPISMCRSKGHLHLAHSNLQRSFRLCGWFRWARLWFASHIFSTYSEYFLVQKSTRAWMVNSNVSTRVLPWVRNVMEFEIVPTGRMKRRVVSCLFKYAFFLSRLLGDLSKKLAGMKCPCPL